MQRFFDWWVPCVLLQVDYLLEINLVCVTALASWSVNSFSIVARWWLTITGHFLMLATDRKDRKCIMRFYIIVCVGVTRVRTVNIFFKVYRLAVMTGMRICMNSSLCVYFIFFVICKGLRFGCESHIVAMNLSFFVSCSELSRIRRLINRLRSYTSVGNIWISVFGLEHTLIPLFLDSFSWRKHTCPITKIPQFHGRVAYKLLLPVYLF